MKVSENGIKLIKQFEGCKLSAYLDAAGVPTIGYGHTKGVKMGQKITQEEAEALLKEDLEKFDANVTYYDSTYNYKFNQNEHDALTSFAFNIGSLSGLTNGGKRTKYQIAQKIQAYVNAGGKKMAGLVKRRKAEYDLFITPVVNASDKYEVGKTYKVVASALKVRKEASVNSDKIKSYRKGTSITVIDVRRDTSGNTWIKTKEGYCAVIYNGEVYVK